MRPVTLLHIADVHLGLNSAPDGGLEERAFAAAMDLAIDADVDAVLIVGDLFDHTRVSDDLLAWTAKELARVERPVVLLVGNHDALDDNSVHHRFRVVERCPNVILVADPDGELVEVPGTDVVVWGRGMVRHERAYKPLAGVPEKPADRWGVVAAHGLVLRDDRPSHHSSPMRPAELDAIEWDYVALGHHHGYDVIREAPTPVVYPGATARSLRGEPGAVVVRFSEDAGTGFEWVPLAV
ncbi:MAG: metallophosphoesterase [Acidimicrobiia bacterium]|nr:metallophosphoesterase [Acidimicrobiia bacterium]MBV9040689.1 metallophosphoesterase [Acidimicrobiia bacterium]